MTLRSYSPPWCLHVTGTYPEREVDPETGEAEPQLVVSTCGKCGDSYKILCTSGAVRTRVSQFAKLHLHADPLDPALAAPKTRTGKKIL